MISYRESYNPADTDEDARVEINSILTGISKEYSIDAYILSTSMADARPMTVDAARAVLTKVAGDDKGRLVDPVTLTNLVYLYAQVECLAGSITTARDSSKDDESTEDEARSYPDNTGYF